MKLAMVSLQPALSPNRIQEFENLSKKRKLEGSQEEQFFEKRSKRESTNSILDIELQYLETPLPLEWQRCLDIQSGQIHFYNTRTHKRTSRDPRRSPEPEPASPDEHMSLELQLSILPCESLRKSHADDDNLINRPALGSSTTDHHQFMESKAQVEIKGLGGSARSTPSWLAFDIGDDQHEMVATVCTRCHMLVMLCKSSPSCPNCKFLHPPDQGTPNLFKRRCTLFC
ncbi:uncharacterized protein LOC108980388 [Juglans regia]|uniref:Uncharacterized protein LOC108980388 n=2 Tax=Juglans regia TaxID=51240 RepID=A0A2I4DI55_JUGRE|nr:uncharacterized protein LOC108980388 [Juglans regia]